MTFVRAEQVPEETEHIALRLVDRIEDCDGFTGKETVVFVGDLHESEYFSNYHNEEKYWLDFLTGLGIGNKYYTNGFTYNANMYPYLTKIMNVRLPLEKYDEMLFTDEENEIIRQMPCFPSDGSVAKIGDRIIVMLSK